jgi:hypothetical protein
MAQKKQKTQSEKVFSIVFRAGKKGISTPRVVSKGLEQGIADAARRLRELQEGDYVASFKDEGSRVKNWVAL